MPATVVVEGADELARLLRQIADKDLQKANRLAFKRGADVVAQEARSHAPVGKTGRLRASIRATGTQRGGSVKAGNSRVRYAAPIHWGRIRGNVGSPPGNRQGISPVTGRPFIYDAAARKAGEVAEIYRAEVMALFQRIGGARG